MLIETSELLTSDHVGKLQVQGVCVNGESHTIKLHICKTGLHKFFGVDDVVGKRIVISDTEPGIPFKFKKWGSGFTVDEFNFTMDVDTFLDMLFYGGIINTRTQYYARLV